jgi:GMP synthase (glutamine-hydrolysing)
VAHLLPGGKVHRASKREFGLAPLRFLGASPLFAGLPKTLNAWMSHGDHVVKLPSGFRKCAVTANCPYSAMEDPARGFYGVQFHPEVVHTQKGEKLLRNFARKVCGCRATWDMASYAKQAIADIRAQVGKGRVLCGVSGGGGFHRGGRLDPQGGGQATLLRVCDNGLLRMDEAKQVVATFRGKLGIPLFHADAEDEFLRLLKDVAEPERKRKIIGATSSGCSSAPQEAGEEGRAFDFLAQGTLYPDVIESVSVKGPSAVIKSHHNVGGLPKDMRFKLVEPLRELFKDEVRALGASWASQEMLWRQPFPGRAWRSVAWVLSPRRSSRSCARPTRSSWRRSRKRACITTSGSPSPS